LAIKKNGLNKDTEKDITIKIQSKEAYGKIQNKMDEPNTERHQEERKELARN
jgi:hypothetical protein